MAQFLPKRYAAHVAAYGARVAQPFLGMVPYPRMTAGNGSRLDAFPPTGGLPGSDLTFMRQQLLDPLGIEYGILQPLSIGSQTFDQGLGAAMCAASNEWQLAKWTGPEPRLKASLCVTQDDPDAAIAEIERHAGNPQFVQVCDPAARHRAARAASAIGRSIAPRPSTTCRSRCTRPPTGRAPTAVAAGCPITSRNITPSRTRCSRS